MKAAVKDMVRTIRKEKKRFLSIMMITTLGVTMMTGLSAGCRDLRYSADRFFDEQSLFDISIFSTLGLTKEDVQVLSKLEGVKAAEGGYSEIVQTKVENLNKTAEIKMIHKEGLNLPYLQEGSLPNNGQEIAVTANYSKDTGKSIGDLVVIEEKIEGEEPEGKEGNGAEEEWIAEEGEQPNFLHQEYRISGIVVDVMDINNAEGSAAFRASPNADYTFFLLPEAIDYEVFTAVYLQVAEVGELLCYTPAYESRVDALVSRIEQEIKVQREQARYDEITREAYGQIQEAEQEMEEEFAKAEQEFADAQEELVLAEQELAKARQELADGIREIEAGRKELLEQEEKAARELADARLEIEDGYRRLEEGQQEIQEASEKLYEGNLQAARGRAELEMKEQAAREQLEEGEEKLLRLEKENAEERQAWSNQAAQIAQQFGEAWPVEVWESYVEAATEAAVQLLREQDLSALGEMNQEQQGMLLQAMEAKAASVNPKEAEAFKQSFQQLAISNPGQTPEEFVTMMSQLALGGALLQAVKGVLEEAVQTFAQQKAYAEAQIAAGWEELRQAEEELAAVTAQIHQGKRELEENRQKLDDAVVTLAENEQKAKQEFADARAKLREGEAELVKGEQELLQGEQEFAEGKQELAENRLTYEEEKQRAREEITEARDQVKELDMTQWYVQDRTSLSGYTNVKSDAASIESLASVFTVVFFVVAILISLTTVTRMVEEERGLIGTYKALGFWDREIRRKYVVYALLSSLTGGILGDFCGFVVLPQILFTFFRVMYVLPQYVLQFFPDSGTIGILFFVAGIVGAALFACGTELRQLPAQLMRPKAPRVGAKIFLEWIVPLWKRLSFLNKVTARNLFRYKKRLLMTISGIAGCTALVLFGFAIKDSVAELMPLQYEQVYKYDLLAVAADKDNAQLTAYLEKKQEIEEYINIRIETVKLKNSKGETEKLQLMIFPDKVNLDNYLTLTNLAGEQPKLAEEGICLTENALNTLGLKQGDLVKIQNLDLVEKEVQIRDVVKNYLGNNIYMSQKAYEGSFGGYMPNGILANLHPEYPDHIGFSEDLAKEDWILSALSTQELKEGFSSAFTLINIVVYVVLVLAAGLAFVVLFTLATTNISERVRELATIKVLGFFDREVHLYVNKETMVLTGIGILLGLPLGAMMSRALTTILKMPSIYFAVTIYPRSFWISAAIALLFALIVQLFTNRTLNKIDPVEALKSVE